MVQPQNYKFALVDIETTGGRSTTDCITELAVIIVDHTGELYRWESLINPGTYIPDYIYQITGISNEMVVNAPRFSEVAETLFNLLKDCIFVAHNARFDYGFIKNHFARLNINFTAKVLCTVRLSRKLFADQKGHSMDKLIERHHLVPLSRHRAMGDADLIKQFIEICFTKFGKDAVISEIKNLIRQSAVPAFLETDINKIPNTPGVYLFHDNINQLPIYIGKSINLRTRIMSHFSSDHKNSRELKMSLQIKHIKFIETAGELEALLLESKLIKEQLPLYNRRLRKNKLGVSFVEYNIDGYKRIKIMRLNDQSLSEVEQDKIYGYFRSMKAAEQILLDLVHTYNLCPKLCGLDKASKYCFAFQLKKCKGACAKLEPAILYNIKVDMALAKYKQRCWPYKGPIAIKEFCPINGLESIHIFHNWQHITSVKSYSDLDTVNLKYDGQYTANIDNIKIIQSFLLTKIKSSQIIDLQHLSISSAVVV